MPPKFFQIGFNKCGTTYIARLFDMNGIPAAHWLEGALAEDIAFARLNGTKPLARWPDTVAFTDMESVRFLNMPIIEAFRDFAFLDDHYSGAVFLLNTRRVEDWVASRYLHRGGSYARSIAAQRGVALADLADIWTADWHAHIAACRAHFGARPEFIEIDIDEAATEDYRRALSPWFDLPRVPDLPGKGVRQARRQNGPRVHRMRAEPPLGAGIDLAARERLAGRLARLAAPRRMRQKGSVHRPPNGDALCLDLEAGTLRDAAGAEMPLRRGPDGMFYLEPQRPGLLRVAAVANDIAAVTARGAYWLDMRPACFAGSEDPADGPLIASLRRTGARNVFLWPAPWLHRIGNDGFPGSPLGPDPAWDERAPVAVWRGTLSGHVPGGRQTAEGLLNALLKDPAAPEPARLLPRTSRWRFLAAHAGTPGLDLALLPDPRRSEALAAAGLTAPAPESNPAYGRLAICLAGSEGDADLLPLLRSQATVLREEGEWESFLTRLFRPWTHLIPMEAEGADLPERLDWAAAHPDDCRKMSRRARRLAASLADPEGRRLHLAQVLAAYRAATGQD